MKNTMILILFINMLLRVHTHEDFNLSFQTLDMNSWTFQAKKFISQDKEWYETLRKDVEWKKIIVIRVQKEQRYQSDSLPESKNRTEYIGNLQNVFSLVTRRVKTWPVLLALLESSFGDTVRVHTLPDRGDELLSSRMVSLLRLQEVYDLPTEILVGGGLQGTHPYTTLTAEDCLEVGRQYYGRRHHRRAVEWLEAALRKTCSALDTPRAMELLYLARCFSGDLLGAKDTLLRLLKEHPTYTFSGDLLANHFSATTSRCGQTEDFVDSNFFSPLQTKFTRGLCRTENQHFPTDPRLRCRLVDYNLTHLKIWPFKMEELHLDPPLLLFHDVIYDKEIEAFKKFHALMRPAHSDYPEYFDPHQDTQNVIWFENHMNLTREERSLVTRLDNRSQRMTNLRLQRSLALMLASYGVGGEDKIHRDIDPNDDFLGLGVSRADYLTVMFYLHDVPAGGATVLPFLDRAIVPAKGTAVLWFNRYPDCTQIQEMIHAGCPVLSGQKWILVKWFHVAGQDFPKCVPGKEKSFMYYYL